MLNVKYYKIANLQKQKAFPIDHKKFKENCWYLLNSFVIFILFSNFMSKSLIIFYELLHKIQD